MLLKKREKKLCASKYHRPSKLSQSVLLVSYWSVLSFQYPTATHAGHSTYLALGVGLDLPASWQLQLSVCELVEENHQIPVMLVAFKVPGITAHLQDHVFHTAAASEHPVGHLQWEPPQVYFYILKINEVLWCSGYVFVIWAQAPSLWQAPSL